jgi:phosphate transport system permease protein
MPAPSTPQEIPARFRPSRAVLWFDALMTWVIKAGGILVITAVLGIFVFIFLQIYPLFLGASVKAMRETQLPTEEYKLLGMDEWGELPFLATEDGRLYFIDLVHGDEVQPREIPFDDPKEITAVRWNADTSDLLVGSADGFFSVVKVRYRRDFANDGRVVADITPGPWHQISPDGAAVELIAYKAGSQHHLAAAILRGTDGREVRAMTLRQRRSLMGAGELTAGDNFDLTPKVVGDPNQILVNAAADAVIVSSAEGVVEYFFLQGNSLALRQKFQPFAGKPDEGIASMNFLLGDVSLVFTNPSGENTIWSLFIPEGGQERLFGQTKIFEPLPGGADFFSASQRNKGFLLGHENTVSLRFGTTESIRWEDKLPYPVTLGAISGKNDQILLLDQNHRLHLFALSDPHPETSFRALFGKVWYEGQNAPSYTWQSTGGSDDFEPKLSLVPLIVGTLKGTFYAMIFAVPIALLAALYTSQFLHPGIRRVVKPTMEIMASLPSVVLGFLAALWLAPILETRVPSVLCILILVPLVAWLLGWALSLLPMKYRQHLHPGWEFVLFTPVFLLFAWAGWSLGPVIEGIFFTVRDSATGETIADFRRWWPLVTGTPFEQRNSLVVGFMMGFAVIPIIFTISEDAMSNVPQALRSGSLALGASRWQTARNIVLPTAAAGIFSALMIGLGRAVGETMIVVMATGNTPIMDFNIFSGMRTLSANIAVELPEAAHHSTLYRTLFLGAMVLFLLTFLINTLAEILRQHLREKFKTV